MKIQINNKQNIFFCSDPHYGHVGIVRGTSSWEGKKGTRDFKTVEEHDNTLVNNINKTVGENDILFCLGDWSFGNYKSSENVSNIRKFREKINCKNIHLILGNHDCFDKQCTEILTTDGWMLFEDWKMFKPKIATYNTTDNCVNYETPISIHESTYSGKMYHIKNRLVDLLITPNHRLYNSRKNKKDATYVFTKASEIPYKNVPVTMKSSSENLKGDCGISDDLIQLTAWILSDGSVKESLYGVSYVIFQSEGKDVIIRNLLNKCRINFRESSRQRDISKITGIKLIGKPKICYEFHIGQGTILEKLIQSKYSFPSWLRKLSSRQFNIFLQAYVLGDGTKQKESSYAIYGTQEVLSQLQELCFLNGHRTCLRTYRNKQYILDITDNYKTSHISRYKDSTEIIDYEGEIFCFKTKNDTLIVRRNGKVVVTGNSEIRKNKDKSKELFTSINDYLEIVVIEQPKEQGEKPIKQEIVLSHYSFRTWNKAGRGTYMLFGHSHGSLKNVQGKTMDVGFDTHPEFRPYNYFEIKELLNYKEYEVIDHH
jgi:calcineurin-like phosphoesterase family protein